MKDKIFIVTHKKLDKMLKRKGYSYIQVGINSENYGYEYRDNNGENIANKNNNYCELTALYWIWKNYKCDKDTIIGLCHYRRFFSTCYFPLKFFYPSIKRIRKYLTKYDIILPKKFKFSTSVYKYYFKGKGKQKDLDKIREIISKLYPDYLNSFDEFSIKQEGYYCNMIILKRKELDKYCEWLFNILFEMEKVTNLENYTKEEARIYGYLSEYLLNVYVIKNNFKIKELYMINTEISFYKKVINKIKKILNFK